MARRQASIAASSLRSVIILTQPQFAWARAELGWQPRVPLDEGLAATVAWMRRHADEFRPGEYAV